MLFRSDKDRALLETDAFASATVPQRKGSDTSLLYPITVSSFNPTPERSRPQSVVSDSGSSRRSAGSISFSDADASSGGTSPPTPDSFTIPSHQRLHPSKPLRLDSSFSSSVHRLRSDSLASETLDYSKEQSPPLSPASTLSGVIVKGKGKESPLHVFVFSDLVVLSRKKEEGGRFKRSSTSSHKSEHEATYKVVDTIGLSSILSVLDLSGKTGTCLSPLLPLQRSDLAWQGTTTCSASTSSRSLLPPLPPPLSSPTPPSPTPSTSPSPPAPPPPPSVTKTIRAGCKRSITRPSDPSRSDSSAYPSRRRSTKTRSSKDRRRRDWKTG